MSPPEGNCFLYKLINLFVFPESPPVSPSDRVVLTPGIIISILGITEFVPSIDHRSSLAEQKHKKCIFDLLITHFFYSHLSGRAFDSAVPGIIILAAVLIIFSVFFIVTVIIGNCIIKGKTVLTCHIVDRSTCIPDMTQMILHSRKHSFVAFQITAHVPLKGICTLCRHFILSADR